MLQVNTLWARARSGAQAELGDTGGNFVYVSLGLSYSLPKSISIYGFVQKPR